MDELQDIANQTILKVKLHKHVPYMAFGNHKCSKINTGGPCHLRSTGITETPIKENFLWVGGSKYTSTGLATKK